MTSSISTFVRKLLVACTWLGLLVLACRGDGDTDDGGEDLELRDGDPPPGLVAQVNGLRAQGTPLSPSEDVGTLPGGGHVGPTGQAGYSIPLDLPPGAGGLAPTLSLEYSSGGGNGLFGLGWTLTGFSSIDRC